MRSAIYTELPYASPSICPVLRIPTTMAPFAKPFSNKSSFTLPACKLAVAFGLVAASFLVGAPARASVLVDPMIRRGQPQPAEPVSTASQNIVDLAGSTPGFSTLTTAIQVANITSILSDGGPFTVFAPTDEAFRGLPAGAVNALLLPENSDLLVKLLYNHVAHGDITSNQLVSGALDTFDGVVSVGVTPLGVTVDGADVVQADVEATNGVIHAVDKVLLPTGLASELQARINSGTSAASTSTTTGTPSMTRAATLQDTAIDRVVEPAPVEPAPVEPTAPAPAVPEEPVRGLW